MSRSPVLESTRRRHSEREIDTVQRLVDASADELEAHGYDGLTVRNVARRAGMAPATAYTYFSSKDHLIAEVFWRRLDALPPVQVDRRRSRPPASPPPCGTWARSSPTSPTWRPRARRRWWPTTPTCARCASGSAASSTTAWPRPSGADATPAVLRALDLAVSGALISAGTGHFRYDEMTDRLAEVARLVVPTR